MPETNHKILPVTPIFMHSLEDDDEPKQTRFIRKFYKLTKCKVKLYLPTSPKYII